MEYILDISEGYTHLLAFSSEFGFYCYMSTPNLSFSKGDKIEIFFENIEVDWKIVPRFEYVWNKKYDEI